MSMTLNEQAIIFLLMVCYGAIACIAFDIFRSICRIFKPSALTVGIVDIVFWLILSMLTFFTLFLTSNGQIRFFEFIAMILGSIIYFLTLSKPMILIFSGVFFCFKKIFCVFLKFFLTIVQFLFKMLLRVLMCIVVPVLVLCKKIKMMFVLLVYKFRSGMLSVLRAKKQKAKEARSCRKKKTKRRKEN